MSYPPPLFVFRETFLGKADERNWENRISIDNGRIIVVNYGVVLFCESSHFLCNFEVRFGVDGEVNYVATGI